MSKGSPIVPVRFGDAETLAEMDEVIRRTADTRPEGPWTRSSFIIKAVQDKLRHIRRSNRKNRRAKKCTSTSSAPSVSTASP